MLSNILIFYIFCLLLPNFNRITAKRHAHNRAAVVFVVIIVTAGFVSALSFFLFCFSCICFSIGLPLFYSGPNTNTHARTHTHTHAHTNVHAHAIQA